MSKINVTYSGNGTAYISDVDPEPNQMVTLYAYPDQGATLDDIAATDSGGHSIALLVTQEQSFRYNADWGNMRIVVTFSGSGPTPPPSFNMWWLLKKAVNNRTRI